MRADEELDERDAELDELDEELDDLDAEDYPVEEAAAKGRITLPWMARRET